MCEHARVFKSSSTFKYCCGSSEFEVSVSLLHSLVMFLLRNLHNAWARAGLRSALGLYMRVPCFLVLQQYAMWCCKLALRLLKMFADVTSFDVSISSRRWCDSSLAYKLNKSWTSGSNITFPLRRSLPTATTTLVIAALINSSVDLMLVGICLDNVAISCKRSLSVLESFLCWRITKWDR